MEKKTPIPQKEFQKGYFIELNCCMCNAEITLGARTPKQLQEELKDKGWKNIDSDQFQIVGFWCGCNYKY